MDADDALLLAYAGGDPEAFVRFYRRHLEAVLGFLLRRTGDPELAADLAAETFAAALIAAARYRPGERPALAWLYGIAAHKLADSRPPRTLTGDARDNVAVIPVPGQSFSIARETVIWRDARGHVIRADG